MEVKTTSLILKLTQEGPVEFSPNYRDQYPNSNSRDRVSVYAWDRGQLILFPGLRPISIHTGVWVELLHFVQPREIILFHIKLFEAPTHPPLGYTGILTHLLGHVVRVWVAFHDEVL